MKRQSSLNNEKGAEVVELLLGAAILIVGLLAVISFNEDAWSNRTRTARCQYQDWQQVDPSGNTVQMLYNESQQRCCRNGICT